MNLESQSATSNNISQLARKDRAVVSCRLAKTLEKSGEYEAAYEALNEFWPEQTGSPNLDDLDEPTKAEVLLRVGALAGWLGSASQIEGSQESAKNLISTSADIFEKLGQPHRAAEAEGELALCYWREGSYDEARIHLTNALSRVDDQDGDLKAILLIRAGMVEVDRHRLDEALRLYNDAAPLVKATDDHGLKGSFHIEHGLVLRRLATPENREDYLDRALIEYAAASFHFEQAGNDRYVARVENNLGFLFYTIGRYKDAHHHLDRARSLFLRLRDVGTAAQVDETRARTLLAEGHVVEAERLIRSAVRTLGKGGQQAVLAEALTTQGIALARLGSYDRSRAVLEQAIEVAATAGDLEGAGRAKLSIIEELGDVIPPKDLVSVYESAIDVLKQSQDPSTGKRLISCAAKLLDVFKRLEAQEQPSPDHSWEGFSFKQHIRKGERVVLERALRDAGGSVSKAARLLGFKHHQSLISLINTRHKELLKTRSVVRKRRRHLFSKARRMKRGDKGFGNSGYDIAALHVEDDKVVARLIADTLEAQGIDVDACMSGTTGLKILTSGARYDILIIDNDLPGLSGLELVRRTRSMARWRGTPIIMFSAEDCEIEAWRAGVDAYLRKPDDIDQLPLTIARLLQEPDGA